MTIFCLYALPNYVPAVTGGCLQISSCVFPEGFDLFSILILFLNTFLHILDKKIRAKNIPEAEPCGNLERTSLENDNFYHLKDWFKLRR